MGIYKKWNDELYNVKKDEIKTTLVSYCEKFKIPLYTLNCVIERLAENAKGKQVLVKELIPD